jgi:proline dehydrogenase
MDLFFLARRFVAGTDIGSALEAVRELNNNGLKATLDVLGENVFDKTQAQKAADAYMGVLERIGETGVDSNVSLKLTQMGLDISDEFCYENMTRILKQAEACRNYVRIDMEGTPYTERTLNLFFRLFQNFKNVGIVVQAYLYRSEQDVRRLLDANARVRLCKGAYKEPPSLAYQKMKDIRKNYLKLAEMLLVDGTYPGIATHDDCLIEAVKDWTAQRGIGKDKFEFQMLYGIRPQTQEQLVKQGYNMRVYVPFGTHWFPYFSRRLRERKENVWFVFKNLFKK